MASRASESKKTSETSRDEDPLVYPVEFKGYHGVDDVTGLKTFTTTARIGGTRWQSHDIQDMRRYKRQVETNPRAAKPRVHRTKAVRYFYTEAEVAPYRNHPGFVVHKPIKRSEAPDTVGTHGQVAIEAGEPARMDLTAEGQAVNMLRREGTTTTTRDTKGRRVIDDPTGGDDLLVRNDTRTTTGIPDTSAPTVPPAVAKARGMMPEEVREIEGDPVRGAGERIPTHKGEGVTEAQEADMDDSDDSDEADVDTGKDVGKADAAGKRTKGKKK